MPPTRDASADAARPPERSCTCPTLNATSCRSVRYGHGTEPGYLAVPPCECICHTDYEASTEAVC
jgi:hypothetical protein